MSAEPRAARRSFGSDRSGATAVEFGLISSMLFLLLIGVVQLGWALHCAASVKWALETSARSLVLNPNLTASDLKTAMVAQLSNVADPSNVTVTLTSDTTTTPGARVLHAHSTYTHSLAIVFMPAYSMTFQANTDVPAT